MPLPVIEVPLYDLTLPSSGKTIKFHPFTVKEKKLFLLVKESNDVKDVVNTVKQVIRNCIVSEEAINVDDMPIIDIEFFFIHLRARSMGEVQTLEFECLNKVGDDQHKCGGVSKLNFNLLQVEIQKNEGHTNIIKFTDRVGVVMKYPNFGMSQVLEFAPNDPEVLLSIIADSIDYVFDEDTIHPAKDEKRADLLAWIEGLKQEHFEKIQKFFESSPKIIGKSQFECGKCGYTEPVTLSGIADFFG